MFTEMSQHAQVTNEDLHLEVGRRFNHRLSVKALAKACEVHSNTIYRWAREGHLKKDKRHASDIKGGYIPVSEKEWAGYMMDEIGEIMPVHMYNIEFDPVPHVFFLLAESAYQVRYRPCLDDTDQDLKIVRKLMEMRTQQ